MQRYSYSPGKAKQIDFSTPKLTIGNRLSGIFRPSSQAIKEFSGINQSTMTNGSKTEDYFIPFVKERDHLNKLLPVITEQNQ